MASEHPPASSLDVPLREYPVLYVDDEAENRVVFEAGFSGEFVVRTAAGGAEALELLSREPIALLMADQRMPGMSGVELCEQVRGEYPHVIRVLVTAYSDQRTAIEAINRAGVSRYLVKPWKLSEISQILRDLLAVYHLGRMQEEFRRALSQKERVACVSAMRAQVLHDLAGASQVMSSCSETLAAILKNERDRFPPDLYRSLRTELQSLHSTADHVRQLHHRAQSIIREQVRRRRIVLVGDLFDDVGRLVRRDIGPHTRLGIQAEHGLRIRVDPTDLRRVLANLVRNAHQALQGAGVPVPRVDLAAQADGDEVEIQVRDNGPGVPPEHRDRLFDLFFTTRRAQGGTGLGLAICRDLVEANDGTIALASQRQGEGADFRIRFPRA